MAFRRSGTTLPLSIASRSHSRSAVIWRRPCARAVRGATSSCPPIPTHASAGCRCMPHASPAPGSTRSFRPHGRCRAPHAGASCDQGVDVHHPRQLEPRAGDRRRPLCDRALLLGGDAGRLAEPRRAPLLAELRLRVVSPARDVAEVTLLVLVFGVIALAVWIRANVAEFRQRFRQAFTVVRTPARWLRTVVSWQLAEWALRLATVWFMLGAFRIEQSARNVLLVQAAESLATLVPISPGGIGTQQALLVYTLRGSASRSALLAFSVGMKLTLTFVNVIVGFAAILLTLRTLRFRRRPTRTLQQTRPDAAARDDSPAGRGSQRTDTPAGRCRFPRGHERSDRHAFRGRSESPSDECCSSGCCRRGSRAARRPPRRVVVPAASRSSVLARR